MIADTFSSASALHALAGGVILGLGSALMLLGAGRIAGVSGIAARASGIADEGIGRTSAFAFLIGLPLGAAIVLMTGATTVPNFPGWPTLVLAGLLVGIGTRLGTGCTSGHGVCGVSRLSSRSIAATAIFMAAGIATVAAARLVGGS